MAQISHECGAGTEVVENLNYSAERLCQVWPTRFDEESAQDFAHSPQKLACKVYNGRLGNRIGTMDGWVYRGRGAAQTTGRENYEKLGELIGLDLLASPDLVNDPKHFLECGVCDFVKLCGCLPWAEQDNLIQVTRHLNGGLNGLDQRREWLFKWREALNV